LPVKQKPGRPRLLRLASRLHTGASGSHAPAFRSYLLSRLAETEPAKAELVKLRFFVGLTMPEAATLDISLATAERYWTFAKSWLYAELADDA